MKKIIIAVIAIIAFASCKKTEVVSPATQETGTYFFRIESINKDGAQILSPVVVVK